MVETSEIPARPEQLTTKFLQQILFAYFPAHQVIDFEWKPMNIGVIAEVVTIAVEFEYRDGYSAVKRIKRRFVGKFLRPEFPFESMFIVESNFYTEFMKKACDTADDHSAAIAEFPFAIPTAIYTSNVLIVMECVESVKTFTCVEGCPPQYIPMLVTKLAQMHTRFWGHDCDGLATPAGIGSQLTGEEKRLRFPGCWKEFVDDISLESSEKAQLISLCHRLSEKTDVLEALHNAVDYGPSSLIHGDYHIANMLVPATGSDEVTWLLDWATCGKGNPLRDLAFFFIVSVRADHRREQEDECLKVYHKALQTEAGAERLSLEELLRYYKMCVLNQFLILVVFDRLSKSLAAKATTQKLRMDLDSHFREVNRRACLSVLDNCKEKELERLDAWCA
uniref:CHK kinase-like domain-containing protein n=1 Tax=Hyaloperonospora arabidopsidis (strain Emoy2) TaxID=559515 RepID=M4BJS2_HYAAE